MSSAPIHVTGPSRVRANFEPEGWRTPADGPRWLYAEAGRLRAVWRLAVFAVAMTVAQPIIEAILAPIFAAMTRSVGEPIAVYPWVTLGSTFAALCIGLRFVDRGSWRSVALGTGVWRPRMLAIGIGVGTACIVATFALLFASGAARIHVMPSASDALAPGETVLVSSSWSATALRLALLLAPAALWEELVFRGYLWTVAEQAGGVVVARWSTAVAFGVVHLMNPGAGVLSTILVVTAGLCLGLLRERTGSLAAVWLAHFAWNWVMAAVLHVAVSGVAFDTPEYRTVVSGPTWWTGGSWGPEGGVAALLVMSGALFWFSRSARVINETNQLNMENDAR